MEDTLVQEITPGIERLAFPAHDITDIDALLSQKRTTLVIKRLYDIIFSALGLMVLLPLFDIVAVLIKLDSPGPVFYNQVRIGKDGVPFRIYKFRKMHDHVGDSGSNLTLTNDQRMTRMGYFLRKSKLDELPQAFNVLLGDMSLGDYKEIRSEYPCG